MTWNPSLIAETDTCIGAVDGKLTTGTDDAGNAIVRDLGPGYRLNVAPSLMADDLKPFVVTPGNPVLSFGDSVCLCFPNGIEQAKATSLGAEWSDPAQ